VHHETSYALIAVVVTLVSNALIAGGGKPEFLSAALHALRRFAAKPAAKPRKRQKRRARRTTRRRAK
jgi:hypothetical protein